MRLSPTIMSIALIFLISACTYTTAKQPVSSQSNNEVVQGFSQQRLTRIDDVMNQYIDAGKLVGTMTLVARNGEIVHMASHGYKDREAKLAMTDDTIFRIYSMTKPITAVAAMTLWEQGKFHMNDPIEWYLPELKDLKVYVSGSGDDMVLEDAKYPIRIIDLFMHTAGFSYGFTGSEVDKLYRELQASQANDASEATMEKALTDLATLPLNHQPGTQWNYGVNTDIIGFLVERLTGMKLGEYMQQVIFDPLNMKDTGFHVKPENVSRFAQVYGPDDKGQTVVVEQEPLGDFLSDPAVHNGGGGLTSTMADYYTFTQMLLNGGEVNGVRILGRKTVQYLTTNHMPDNLLPYAPDASGEGYALAMSVTVDEDQSRFMASTGDYGWGGAASTYFRIDPKEQIIVISLAQFLPIGFHRYHDDFRNVVYQALVE